MTNIIVIGENQKPKVKKKSIQLVYFLGASNRRALKSSFFPSQFKNIELISRGYNDYDLIFAYNDDRNSKGNDAILFLGHWNDGVVE